MKSAGKNTQTMNFQRVTSVTFSLTGLFLPAEYPCSHLWLHVHEIHVLLDRSALQVPPPRCGMFVSLWVGSYQNTYRKPCFVFHFFSENWIVHMSFMCRCFLMVLCCTNLKTLWSLMVMWLCGNPHKWLLWRNRRSVTVNRSINQSTQKWSEAKYLRIFLFQWKHLKISQIDTYQIHKLPLPPLGSIYLQTSPEVFDLHPFGSDPTCCSNLAAFPILSHHGPPEKSV